jgi:2-desacetyl-2-hydroxyethyl bacteriochlorophyllide A dehydrogenase
LHKAPAGTDLKLAALTEPLAVACHDVRLGGIKPGELVVVLGGGPIGILVALVAKAAGANVILSELSETRLQFARGLGLEAVNPAQTDLAKLCQERSRGSGADVVFEVSGAKAALATITDLLAIRGRIVIVAIFPKPVELNLQQFFWKELQLRGVRVYEPEDYEKAIALVAARTLPLEKLITKVEPLERLQQAFEDLDSRADAMKVLIDCTK